ncbi:GlxA family transcriptional regulator [uncultured Amphritea sp.]|uniref:GlxA family transcriptional regulator n=1 Tax=uncultured Amphritea sp. TaxID=981605 RepID=UPI0025D1D7C5|nr:GlxA family transcriptional regulator [uncultured Amphritea sp.]
MLKHIDQTDSTTTILPGGLRPVLRENKKEFSHLWRETNRAFLPFDEIDTQIRKVCFILPEHFSMLSFTAAVDALVTANLVHTAPLFSFETYAVGDAKVRSDLGIEISTDGGLGDLKSCRPDKFDLIVLCGGYRCSVTENHLLSNILRSAARKDTIFAGIWNGAIPLAYAGLMDNLSCALHPDNHAFMRERFQKVSVSGNILEIESQVVTSAGPASALEMMLQLIGRLKGGTIMRAIREILSCDQVVEPGNARLLSIEENPVMPQNLLDIIQLMRANIDDPLSMDDLVACLGISRRQIERLFQNYLQTSPGRYYLELRVTYARRLLLQSNASVTDVAIACGFVTSSHFSNCFKDYFGLSPSQLREHFRKNLS